MKRIVCLITAAVMLALCGCSAVTSSKQGIQVVCAAFAEYDWVKNIVGEGNINVTILADTGTDMHSYQPTAADIVSIAAADLVVYNGGTADGWMTDALKNADNEAAGLRLMDVLSDRLQHESTEGIGEHDHDHGHDHHDGEGAYDEHIWLSLKNASIACQKITDRLCEIDKDNADGYRINCENYVAELNRLDEDFAAEVETSKNKSVVIADRFPFLYLMNDYCLNFYAAFPGCSSETDADFKTVIFLAEKLDELKLDSVLVIEGSSSDLAKTVIDNTEKKNQQVLILDSMQSVTKKDVAAGKSYLNTMKKNLSMLKKAL